MRNTRLFLLLGGALPFFGLPLLLEPPQVEPLSPSPAALPVGKAPTRPPSSRAHPERTGEIRPLSPALPRKGARPRRFLSGRDPWGTVTACLAGRLLRADGSPAAGLRVNAYAGLDPQAFLFLDRKTPGPRRRLPDYGSRRSFTAPFHWFLLESPSNLASPETSENLEWTQPLPSPSASARAGKDGRFSLVGIPPFHHVILAAREGDRTLETFFPIPETRPGGTLDLGDLRLPPFGRIEGKVLGPGGRPVSGARVTAFGSWDEAYRLGKVLTAPPEWILFAPWSDEEPPRIERLPTAGRRVERLRNFPSTRTGPDGRFVLERVPAGKRALLVRTRSLHSSGPIRVEVPPGREESSLVIRLQPGGAMALQVLGPGGVPMKGVEVLAASSDCYESPIPMQKEGKTGRDGRIVCPGLSPGRIYFALRRGLGHPWRISGPWALGAAPVIRMDGGRKSIFRCLSKPGDRPLLPEKVTVTHPGDTTPLDLALRITGKDTFALEGLPPGLFLLKAQARGHLSSRFCFTVSSEPSVTGKPTVVPLWKEQYLQVLVRDLQGRPRPGTRVYCRGEFPQEREWDSFRAGPVTTDSSGRARLGPIPPARLTLFAACPAAPRPAAIHVSYPFPKTVVWKLGKLCRIEGRVAGLPPRKRGTVLVLLRYQYDLDLFDLARVGGKGTFLFDRLFPGDYELSLVKGPPILSGPRSPDLACTLFNGDAAKNLCLKPEETSRITLEWKKETHSCSVEGRVTICGSPAPGLKVSMDAPRFPSTWTDETGRFELEKIPSGRYDLNVEARVPCSLEGDYTLFSEYIELAPGTVLKKEIELPAGRIMGTARDRRGAPIPGLKIDLEPEKGNRVTVVTDAAGTFSLFPAPSGPWTAGCFNKGFRLYPKKRFTLPPGRTVRLDLTIPRSYLCRLLFVKPSGNPFNIRVVRYIPLEYQFPEPLDDRGYGDDGSGQIHLPAGNYSVQVWEKKKNSYRVWEGTLAFQPGLEGRIPVQLAKSWNPALKGAVLLSGRVLPVGVFAKRKWILQLRFEDSPAIPWNVHLVYRAALDEKGRFSLRLVPGRYYFHVFPAEREVWRNRGVLEVPPRGKRNLMIRLRSRRGD